MGLLLGNFGNKIIAQIFGMSLTTIIIIELKKIIIIFQVWTKVSALMMTFSVRSQWSRNHFSDTSNVSHLNFTRTTNQK